jgi:DNA-binding NarL/FixJ family response regulator
MKHRVLVADGHWLIRRGLRAALHHVDDHEVVGEAINASEAVASTLALVPDLVLVDVGLPGGGGIEALRRIKQRLPGKKVLMLSDRGGGGQVREALSSACNGFVCKETSDADLLEAIRCVRNGKIYLDAEMTREMVLAEHDRETLGNGGPLDRLSPRELAVFKLVGAGLTNRDTGQRLQLSAKTVEKYRATAMQKLGLRDAVELRLLALELGVASRPNQIGARTLDDAGLVS